jgi:hypothetical protein
MDFYPDAEEEISIDFPKSKGRKVRMTVYVDTDHAIELLPSRFTTGVLLISNNTPMR